MKPVKEITLDQLKANSDWEAVFGEDSGGNTDRVVESAKPGLKVNLDEVSREDVKKIIAAANGENDGADWIGLFELKDGRFLIASGGCDYTGWDCHASNHLAVADSLTTAIRFGLGDSERLRLGLE